VVPGSGAERLLGGRASLWLTGAVLFTVTVLFSAMAGAGERVDGRAETPVDFNRDVRPILSNVCYTCHGPDEGKRQAGLRLDLKEGALGEVESGGHAVVPGNSAASVVMQRLTHADPSLRMPPAEHDKQLTAEQVETIRRWIDQGAVWRGHWSFETPVRPELPAVSNEAWCKNPIDRFVLARLDREGIAPAEEADRATLIRRVTLDLTGLPPTPAEIDTFLADTSPDAYERVVDRLLASPRYGEHMGRYWLDLARYGDTHGLHLDNERSMWPYREWVIKALNDNLSFDRFTIEQLAGDLLPGATLEQKIATGFNRCNVTTSEGGSIDEEFYVRYAVDRVETASTVWLGLTAGCAVCHDHKYDPITQRDFYGMFAFFNSLTEKAMDGNAMSPPPTVPAPTEEQKTQLAAIQAEIAAADAKLSQPLPEIDAAQQAWEAAWRGAKAAQWTTLDPQHLESSGGSTLKKLDDSSVLAEGNNPDKDVYAVTARTDQQGIWGIRLEVLTDASLPSNGPGRSSNSNLVLSEFEAEAVSIADPTQVQKVEFGLAVADHSQATGEYFIAKAIDGVVDAMNGWAAEGYARHENRTAIFVTKQPVGFAGGTELRIRLRHESQFAQHGIGRFRLAVSSDGDLSPVAWGTWQQLGPFTAGSGADALRIDFGPEKGVDLAKKYGVRQLGWQAKPEWKDGAKQDLSGTNAATYLFRTVRAASARQVQVGLGSDDGVKLWLNGQLVHEVAGPRGLTAGQDQVTLSLAAGENQLLMKVVNEGGAYAFAFAPGAELHLEESLRLAAVLALTPEQRTAEQTKQLREYYRQTYSPEWKQLRAAVEALREKEKAIDKEIPRALVMEDMPQRRDAFVLVRGEYDKKGDKVEAAVPAALGSLDDSAPRNRLGFAQWLVDPAHPLVARVTVNRFWQQYFGTGIVKTSEDFGAQGEWPSHPELLDWLSREFVDGGWNIKGMQRLIVTSATYRQSAKMSADGLNRDRENRLLARGPRFRMDAEMVRDGALAISGLLVEQLGQKSAKPYNPSGLWEAIAYTSSNTAKFVQDHGDGLYRRSMYTFWKRTSPPATMQILDAPSREACVVRRARTNTPLQALVLMNDVQFVEAARRFAERIMREGGTTASQRAAYAMRLATGRQIDEAELELLVSVFERHRAAYEQNREAAQQLVSVGEAARDDQLDVVDLAAWTMVANLILNLDETVTKG
jgi:hypothetical protein